jgi:hypothetical protein
LGAAFYAANVGMGTFLFAKVSSFNEIQALKGHFIFADGLKCASLTPEKWHF